MISQWNTRAEALFGYRTAEAIAEGARQDVGQSGREVVQGGTILLANRWSNFAAPALLGAPTTTS